MGDDDANERRRSGADADLVRAAALSEQYAVLEEIRRSLQRFNR